MAERLIYLPLGGAGEIGMNAYVYGYGEPGRERLIVVDLGVTFGDMDSAPGIDLIMADLSWLEANRDRIEAIFITHAHEDHYGALLDIWPIFEAFQLTYVSKGLLLEQEKNASALSPNGPLAGASATAKPARKPARTARRD